MKQKMYLTLACCMVALAPLKAQSIGPATLNAAGGTSTIGSNTYEYSIGEMAVTSTYTGAGLVVTQGVLQPQKAPTSIAQHGIPASDLSVYPNPVQSTLFLQPSFTKGGNLQYVLTDASGKTVLTQQVRLDRGRERQEINMMPFAAGQYTLSVEWADGARTSTNAYKIQKLQ